MGKQKKILDIEDITIINVFDHDTQTWYVALNRESLFKLLNKMDELIDQVNTLSERREK